MAIRHLSTAQRFPEPPCFIAPVHAMTSPTEPSHRPPPPTSSPYSSQSAPLSGKFAAHNPQPLCAHPAPGTVTLTRPPGTQAEVLAPPCLHSLRSLDQARSPQNSACLCRL